MDRRAAAVSIASAREARSDDIAGRQTRYIVSMLIRTACFVGAVAADGVLRWVLVAAAVFLPYIAVILANAGVQKDPTPPSTYAAPTHGELDTRPPSQVG